jgi:CHAT domain-containing protein/Tfp pilus assembly protein PilF
MASRFYALVFVALTGVLVILSPTDLALKTAQAQTVQDLKAEVDRLLNLGFQQCQTGQCEAALQSLQQALIITREIKDRKREVWLIGNLGNAYDSLGNYVKAVEYYQQALAIMRELNDRSDEGRTMMNLGNAYNSLGNYVKAVEYYQQALEIMRELNDLIGESHVLENLVNTDAPVENSEKAIEYNLQWLAVSRKLMDGRGVVAALRNLTFAYHSIDTEKAIKYNLQWLMVARKLMDGRGVVAALGNLAITYYFLGKYDKAIEYQQQRLAIAREIKDNLGESSAFGNLGRVYYSLGQYDKAIEYQRQSLVLAREIENRYYEGNALEILGSTLAKQKQIELAILYFKQCINVRESIRKDIKKNDNKDVQKLHSISEKSYLETVSGSYKQLANLLIQQNRIIEALQVLDLLKVQELEDYLKNIKGSDRSAQGVKLLAPEQAISDKLLTITPDNSQDINNQLANQIQQLPKNEINRVPDYLNQIPRGTILLYPFILGDRLEIILFSPNNLPIRRTTTISKDQLETLIIDFRSGLLDASSEDVKAPSIQLYNILIKPIEAELVQFQAKTILYAPDGQLRYVPIAALYDGKQWLAEKYQISNLIAYTLSDFSPQPKNSPNILAGAFGGKAGEKKFGQTALPATVREVQAIANSFQNSVTLIEEQFSRQAIESKFKNHNILHLATHAEFNTGAPDQSFIIFGNGDKIRLNEIADWQMPNIDLIILSACQTGSGKLGDGVEILGFGYQVQKAGAKQAIASLWKVDDNKTSVLMTAFYEELQKGNVTATEALRRAQVSLIKSKDYNHPYYWSAFFAIGNGL